ncbi:MAG TPA: D-alanyl-D-alanine carboxypeptidase/D-alanyl-D-alanine-endopeptidase [Solirubrobacterales bacterium]|nr:D-alanyl-D-alanine carboxypeptidase/D-alanyl-D-alanine-endopeptidase [Solirubrobacterales bacterium]
MRAARPLGLAIATLLLVLPGAVAHATTPAKPLTDSELTQIQSLMATPPFDLAVWGMSVSDLDTGKVLYEQNADSLFYTASTTKNFTSAATLDRLGKNHRFRTPVVRLGDVSASGTLRGRLALVASGDLTMGGRALPNGGVAYTGFDHMDANEVPGHATLTPQNPLAGLDSLARQVRRSGVKRVAGDVVIDDRLWRARMVGHEVVSPIVINDNAIDITMRPGKVGGPVRAQTRPSSAAYDIDVRVKTVGQDDPTDVVVHEAHGHTVRVTGTLAAGSKPFVQIFRVPDPAYFARSLFVDALRRAGVRVDAPTVAPNRAGRLPARGTVAGGPRLARLISPRLSEFVKLIQKVSHNLGANTVPFWLSAQKGRSSLGRGMRMIRDYARQAGVPADQFELVDGQGGPGNRISPGAMVTLLRYVQGQKYAKAFYDALPIKGVDGIPMDPELDPATGHVVQKNGVNGAEDAEGRLEVQSMALAGYVTAGERRLAFDVVVNHVPIFGPDGQHSEDPAALVAAFTRFEPLEAITSLLYTSQLDG